MIEMQEAAGLQKKTKSELSEAGPILKGEAAQHR